ncbi:MAG: hypothetical protein A7315_02180 [Candidatus Altiarchaeales archaeon WOR_SM1_79]|nr:MAG: hypothetical protein A7315_02180 [Candidatus Altiarchaeales archaeon WOR_SM1_79]
MKPNDDSRTQKKSMNWKKILLYSVPIVFIILIILFVLSLHWISSDVKAICKKAQQQFEGDCVEALICALESNHLSFKEKNQSIWALGEIGDKRALPALQKLYTGKPCPKPCDSSQYICQYGVKKAIRGCKGFNVVRYVWRWI